MPLPDAPIVGAEPPPGPTWSHRAAPDLQEAAGLGLQRALAENWSTGPMPTRVAALRGWLVMSCWARASLVGHVEALEGDTLRLDPAPRSGLAATERAEWAALLSATPALLAHGSPGFGAWDMPHEFATDDGADGADVAGLPVLAIAAIAISGAAAVAYCAHQAAQVVDNYLERDHVARQVLAADAQALQVIERHVDRERAEGKALDLDDASRAVLNTLGDRQKVLAEKQTSPVQSGAPSASTSAVIGFVAAAAVAVFVAGYAIR